MVRLSSKVSRRLSLVILVAVVAIGLTLFFISSKADQQVIGQVNTPENFSQQMELSYKAKLQYPPVFLINDIQRNIDGVQLVQVTNNSISYTHIEDSKGILRLVPNDGLARATLYHGITPDGRDIAEVTLTNTSTSKFYVEEFNMIGVAPDERPMIGSYAINADYSPQVWGNIPPPTSTKLTILNPGQSISEYVEGKWIEPVTNQTVYIFGGHVLFIYDKGDPNYNGPFNWSIHVQNVYLTTGSNN